MRSTGISEILRPEDIMVMLRNKEMAAREVEEVPG